MEHSISSSQILMILLAALVGFFLWMIKRQVTRIEDKTANILTTEKCEKCHKEMIKQREQQWNVINRHGHRGLDGDANEVVICHV